ncbi:YciI family protein [Coralloluteibacterium stylophorae]|uniref:YciI family protein n=1 Tax=Coralloluteibacterium stylophorae TaxID=1776034 RepID=A0A8J7VTQ0_9GAMM|nr:YciI family protein [Coralloluteibacterium stylophorae]MBS7456267.1 YciI family protein [Coralloluteibacterium stylophorae]
MRYLLLVNTDPDLLDALPPAQQDDMMRECVAHAAELRESGTLLASQRLAPVETATTVRIRNGRMSTTDGPFAETREHFAGYNLIEARDLNDAIRIAQQFPWARTGSIEIRPLADLPATPEDVKPGWRG